MEKEGMMVIVKGKLNKQGIKSEKMTKLYVPSPMHKHTFHYFFSPLLKVIFSFLLVPSTTHNDSLIPLCAASFWDFHSHFFCALFSEST